jgi:hypothetical protein
MPNALTADYFLDLVPAFGSAEYWKGVIQNGIGCTLGSLLAIAVSYAIYKAANIKSDREKNLNQEHEARDILIYFRGIVNNIIQISKQQVKNLEEYIERIHLNNIELPILSLVPMYSLKRVIEGESLDRILVAYVRQFPGENSVKEFGLIISAIEYLYGQFMMFPEEMKLAQNYDLDRKTQYQKLFRESHSLVGKFMLNQDPSNPSPGASEIEPTMNDFAQHHTSTDDLPFYYQYFFEPINDTMVAMLSGVEKNPIFVQLAETTRDGKQMFNFIKSENSLFAESLRDVIPSLNEQIDKLQTNGANIIGFTHFI